MSAQHTSIHLAIAAWEWPSYFDPEQLGFGEHDAGERLGAFAAAPDQGEVCVLFAPLEKGAPPVHGCRGDQHGVFRGIDRGQDLLQVLHQPERAVGPAGDGVGEEVHILEPDCALAPEHRDGLHHLAKAVHRAFDLIDVGGEAADDFPRKFIGDLGRQVVEPLLARPADEIVVLTADQGEIARGGHPARFLASRPECPAGLACRGGEGSLSLGS